MGIRVIGHNGELVFPFEDSEAWMEFSNVLRGSENRICGNNPRETMEILIANFHSESQIAEAEQQELPLNKRHLILWEPEIVESTRYSKSVLQKYGHVYAPSVLWAERVNGVAFKWPQAAILRDDSIFQNWGQRYQRTVMIQGNKFSARKGELYSLRRRALKSINPLFLDLYGTNWNVGFKFDWWHWSRSARITPLKSISLSSWRKIGSRYRNYLGESSNKHVTLTNYRICLVIENAADFVSEKLFDSARAGCVTVYVGPNLQNFGIPSSAAIQVSTNVSEIRDELESLLRKHPDDLLEIARSQRDSIEEISSDWHNTHVLRNLAKQIMRTSDGS